jgi:hypothetical protein
MSMRCAQIHTCDRCGKTHACLLNFGVYESLPEDWLHIDSNHELCPECAFEFRTFATKFFGDKVPKEWDIEKHCLPEY